MTVADQGFPVGGRRAIGGANLRCRCFLAKTYVKTKELDPVGGGGATPPWIRQCVRTSLNGLVANVIQQSENRALHIAQEKF